MCLSVTILKSLICYPINFFSVCSLDGHHKAAKR